jgi:hypothetical protein
MKSLGAALASSLLAVIVAFYALANAGLDKNLAAEIAAAIIGAVPFIREFLEKTFPLAQTSRKPSVLPLRGFGLPPHRLTLYGTLIVVGTMELGSGLGGLTAAFLDHQGGISDRQALYVVGTVAGLIQFPVIFSVGRWVGRRGAAHDVTVIFMIGFFARLGAILVDLGILRLLPPPSRARIATAFGIDFTLTSVSVFLAGGTVVFFLTGLLGYWRGRRHRLAGYLAYLLQAVSEDTRKVIVDLAFEEARATLSQANRPAMAENGRPAVG